MDLISLSVPGNLLLMGEYIILEEGGLGVCLAIAERAKFKFKKSKIWSFFSKTSKKRDYKKIENESDFVYKIFSYFKKNYYPSLEERAYEVYIDTSAFYYENGKKRGYGSSAVVAVGLSAIFHYAVEERREEKNRELFEKILKAYRYAQGNKGSGYDIASSLFGSVGIFKGGFNPVYEYIPNFTLEDAYILQGEREVKTIASISSYERNKEKIKDLNYYKEKNELLANSIKSDFLFSMREAKKINLELAEKIGVDSILPDKFKALEKSCLLIKPMGAGNETFLVYKPKIEDFSNFYLKEIKLEPNGILWD